MYTAGCVASRPDCGLLTVGPSAAMTPAATAATTPRSAR